MGPQKALSQARKVRPGLRNPANCSGHDCTTFGPFIVSASGEELFKIAIGDELKIRGIFTRLFQLE